MRDAQNNLRTATSNTNFPDANWHHLVGVLDEVHSNLTFYVDGVKVPVPLADSHQRRAEQRRARQYRCSPGLGRRL